jgi:uncharacterized DUF497 family protein
MPRWRLRYDEDRIEHIAQHSVEIDEVEEVLSSGQSVESGWENDKRRIYGPTESGRYLMVVLGRRRRSRDLWLVTAREMTDREKKRYRRRRR